MNRVAIYAITRGDPRIEFVGPLFQCKDRADISHIHIHPTLYLDHGRQECVNDFLAYDRGDWLMFIDDDTSFTMETLDQLFAAADEHGDDAVYGGIYWSPVPGTTDPTNDVFPMVFQRQAGQRDEPAYRDTFTQRPFPRAWTAAQTAPFLCDAVGTGFMLIPKGILQHLAATDSTPLPHFQMDVIEGVASGEDLVFCHRAREAGYPIIAVPVDNIYHMKLCRIGRPKG